MATFKLDIKDALRRVRGIGKLVNLVEESSFVRIGNALLSMERARLDEAVEKTKKHFGDWAGVELDNWWGSILSMQRLVGVEDVSSFMGDGSYVARLRKYMEAANQGISLEAVRKAAEAGSGVPFDIHKADNRIILVPKEPIAAVNKAGLLRAIYRIAPARAIIELAEPESYDSSEFVNVWSDSVYVGNDPTDIRTDGPAWNSPNQIIAVTADKWGATPIGSQLPGNGLPNNLVTGGAWAVPVMGAGEQANLIFGTEANQLINRVKFSVGAGSWRVILLSDSDVILVEEFDSNGWHTFDKVFNFHKDKTISAKITNDSQEQQTLLVRGAYVGTRVDSSNRVAWLNLGGEKGVVDDENIIIADPLKMFSGGEWVSQPVADPSMTVNFYGQVSGSPRIVTALGFKTRTPGALFRVSYSTQDLKVGQNYTDLTWTQLPVYYKLKNGRVDTLPFKAKHIKLTFTNLRPMLLKEFQSQEEVEQENAEDG